MKTYIKIDLRGSVVKLFVMLLVMGVTFVSCQDSSLISMEQETGPTLTASAANNPGNGNGNGNGVPDGLTSNAQIYNNSSMPAASGRDGEVVVTARALLDGDGEVDLEVTTGALDSDETAPGTLTKLLVKALDKDNPDLDNPVWEQNYNKLRDGGYFITSYDNLVHGQPLYVHSNVRGIIRGIAVVKVTETVKYRPDLQVVSVNAPKEILVNDVAHITAEITENLDDLGARANCVLYVDGTEIDRASGIWVDAGDAVTCAFSTSFDEVGVKQVTIAAEDVIPGDFDMANNSAETQIKVIEPSGNDFFWWSSTWDYSRKSIRTFDDGSVQAHEDKWQNISLGGRTDKEVKFPMDVTGSMTSDGNEVFSLSLIDINPNYSWSYYSQTRNCYIAWGTRYSRIQVCDVESDYYGDHTSVYISKYGNRIVYYGNDIYGNSYYYDYGWGVEPVDLGSNIAFDFQLDGSAGSARLQGDYQLRVYENSYSRDYDNHFYEAEFSHKYGWAYGYPN